MPKGRGYIIVLGIENEENNDFLLYLVDIYVIIKKRQNEGGTDKSIFIYAGFYCDAGGGVLSKLFARQQVEIDLQTDELDLCSKAP